jgi:Tol biopolymer transport system component
VSVDADESGVFWQLADGSGPVDRIVHSEQTRSLQPEAWSKDGRTLILSASIGGARELMTVDLGADRTPSPLVPVWSSNASLSADGKWIAYGASDLGGVQSIWVRPFPLTEARYQIASDDASDPVWSPDGRRLFYVVNRNTESAQIVAVDISNTAGFVAGRPMPLPIAGLMGSGARIYDLSPDGKSFVFTVASSSGHDPANDAQIHVVLNWFEELKRRVPVP